jgi:hypothetical protein
LPRGRKFQDVRELKRLLLADEAAIARSFLRQLVVFATGAPAQFRDRPEIERILARAASSGYGVRSLLHELITSELFRSK